MYAPVFKGPDGATFTVGMKTKIASSTWYGELISMPSPVMGQDIYAVGQVIADLGELAKSWEWARATGKLERERELEKPKDYPNRR